MTTEKHVGQVPKALPGSRFRKNVQLFHHQTMAREVSGTDVACASLQLTAQMSPAVKPLKRTSFGCSSSQTEVFNALLRVESLCFYVVCRRIVPFIWNEN